MVQDMASNNNKLLCPRHRLLLHMAVLVLVGMVLLCLLPKRINLNRMDTVMHQQQGMEV